MDRLRPYTDPAITAPVGQIPGVDRKVLTFSTLDPSGAGILDIGDDVSNKTTFTAATGMTDATDQADFAAFLALLYPNASAITVSYDGGIVVAVTGDDTLDHAGAAGHAKGSATGSPAGDSYLFDDEDAATGTVVDSFGTHPIDDQVPLSVVPGQATIYEDAATDRDAASAQAALPHANAYWTSGRDLYANQGAAGQSFFEAP